MNSIEIAYFDNLITGFDEKHSSRHVHLGYWPDLDQIDDHIDYPAFTLAQQRLNELIIKQLDIKDGDSILDIGCGLGGNIEALNQRYSNISLAGLNIDQRQLNICQTLQSLNNNQIQWHHCDACDLPFHDHYFDHVISIEAMFHFSSRQRLFSEVSRVLKPSGSFVATDIMIDNDAPNELRQAVTTGYTPWPNSEEQRSVYKEYADEFGLSMISLINIERNTAPGHAFTAASDQLEDVGSDNHLARAGIALRLLSESNHLAYNLIVLRKD